MNVVRTGGITVPFVPSGSYPARSGNLVRPLIDGEPAFRRICEAIEMARRSIWVTVTFMWSDCQMPDARGIPFDVLDHAAAQGIDVRIIFWRPDEETAWLRQNAFWGSPAHTDFLNGRRSGVKIRWDRAAPGFCQHQKSWLIDADDANETAFVGGINLNPHSMVAPGHRGVGHNHDAYLEIAGPSVVDVHHNFVQRWNGASERLAEGGSWGTGSEADLHYPVHVPAECGAVIVQIQRTMPSGRYADGRATPKGAQYDIASGERSNFEQYCAAILAARRSIYIENQQVDVPEILDCLHRALAWGIEVVLLVPVDLEFVVQTQPELPDSLRALMKFGNFDNFTLAGIAGIGADGNRRSVYVHSKLMLVDDEWATVGSCNLHRFSLFGNSEMNAAFSDPRSVHDFRCALLQEHLDQDTSEMDDRSALRLFRDVAKKNRRKLEAGDNAWQGLAFELTTKCNDVLAESSEANVLDSAEH